MAQLLQSIMIVIVFGTLCNIVQGDQVISSNKLRERMKFISGIASHAGHTNRVDDPEHSYFQDIKYSDAKINTSYQAAAKFNPKGMGHLYYVTNYFLDLIQKKESLPNGLLTVHDSRIEVADINKEWKNILRHYSGLVAIIAFGLLFAVLMPCIGFIYCCCRCSGKCGERSKYKQRSDGCKRATFAIFLSSITVVILFGVVCAFVTNEYMKTGTETFTSSLRTNVKDAELFLANCKIEVDNLLVLNYNQLESTLTEIIGETGDIVRAQLANASRAVALTNLTAIVKGLDTIKKDLADIKQTTEILQSNVTELSDALEITRDDLIRKLETCQSEPACRTLLNQPEILQLRVVQNFSELPDISSSLKDITDLMGSGGSIDNIQEEVLDGQKNFDTIKDEIMKSVETTIPQVKRAIRDAGRQLESTSTKIKKSVDEVQHIINKNTGKSIYEASDFIDQYAIYRYYIGLGISCTLLLILVCLAFGLLCGICGKKTYDYSDEGDCCNKAAGGRFLMLGVWIMFLTSTFLMLITLILFIVGAVADRGICKPLSHPENDKVFELVDNLINIDNIYQGRKVSVNLSEIIISCHNNKSIYDTLKLDNMVDIEEVRDYKRRYRIQEEIVKFKNRINVRTDRIELLTPDARRKLNGLANSPLNNIQFEKYFHVLEKHITSVDLTKVSQELRASADKIPTYSKYGIDLPKIKSYLRSKASFLEHLQINYVQKIKDDTKYLRSNVSSLEHHLKFNHTDLRAAVQNLLYEIENAQNYLKNNGSTELKLLVDAFATEFTSYVDKYLDRVVWHTRTELGRCAPLSNVYNSTLMVSCNKILDPFNGFWASVGWCVLLFIPGIIFAAKLATLYQRPSTCIGPYGESEYLYDAYADRDNMPLANVDKKKNHHRSYENSTQGYLQDYSAHLGRSTERPGASGDARFNDMAPKQWNDFQGSRALPRYQSTEYERPPPYYYPGPGERS